jgi:hypothetical protein
LKTVSTSKLVNAGPLRISSLVPLILKILNLFAKPTGQFVQVFALHLPRVYQTILGGTSLFLLTCVICLADQLVLQSRGANSANNLSKRGSFRSGSQPG